MSLILLSLSQQTLAVTGERQERPTAELLPESEPVLESLPLPELPAISQDEKQLSSMAYIEVKQFQFEG
ncbi:hypothetical protein QUF50_10430, partial [Thiotrichales bacterium HSG1]|nr:hypothetical protein [Thiotrichales bacterium HSG1]